ncbi:YEATS domain-containing protein 4 [Blyttiomyces sp. JEL0837]|nr:YEATS domain-containing protein 4 [Blyttiomyces sp. JEL0837]
MRVIDRPPFEVTETGWGEFEIMIKIQFQDPSEKPVQLYHQLQLYPKEDNAASSGLPQPKKAVVSERYEEIVFNEPTEEMYEVFTKNPLPAGGKKALASAFNLETEGEEIKKYNQINEIVAAELGKAKMRMVRNDVEIKKLQAEIKALEGAV